MDINLFYILFFDIVCGLCLQCVAFIFCFVSVFCFNLFWECFTLSMDMTLWRLSNLLEESSYQWTICSSFKTLVKLVVLLFVCMTMMVSENFIKITFWHRVTKTVYALQQYAVDMKNTLNLKTTINSFKNCEENRKQNKSDTHSATTTQNGPKPTKIYRKTKDRSR